jgi:hypothetical protein
LSWADSAISTLAAADRPAGRVALLVALAPHQVSEADIDGFRRGGGDAELIAAAAWASMAAALQIGSWLTPASAGA